MARVESVSMPDAQPPPDAFTPADRPVASELLPLVYDELRRLASQKLGQENAGQTLQTTELVHEAYLRLVKNNPEQPWNNRGHFFGAAAKAMHRILVENARKKRRLRHGGDRKRQKLNDIVSGETDADRLGDMAEHLEDLARENPTAAEVVKLRFFVGFKNEEIAEALAIAPRTVIRHWKYARAWLNDRLGEDF